MIDGLHGAGEGAAAALAGIHDASLAVGDV